MSSIVSKVLFRPKPNKNLIELCGELDEDQLFSPQCEYITVKTNYWEDNKIKMHLCRIQKSDVIQIIVLKEDMRYIIDKQSFLLNNHIDEFIKIEM